MDRSRPLGLSVVTALVVACLLAAAIAAGAPAGAAPAAPATGSGLVATPAAPSAGCGASAIGAGDTTVTISSSGVDRTYIRHVPPAHDGTTPVPLVIAAHGLAEGSVLHQQTTEYAPRADEHGFAVVYPQALNSPASWNLSPTSPDLTFLTDLLDEVEGDLCLDTNRIYMSGFSMGAMLTSLAMCGPLSERIAAVAPVAGLLDVGSCAPERPVPVISFHGTLDNWVAFGGIPANVAAWADRNGCDAPPTETPVPGDEVVTIDHITYPCPTGAEVEFYRITEGGHAWPGSAFSRAIEAAVGYTTFAITATDLIWAFFEAHPLPVAEAPTEGTFDALTYNVAGLPLGLSSSQPEINTPYISPLLNDYDLVLVQEDWANPDPPIPGATAYHHLLIADVTHPYLSDPAPIPLGSNPARPTALLSDGLNRMSRFPFGPITRQMWPNCFGGADTSDGGAADCLAEKGFEFGRTELAPGVEVDVYNLHAEAGNTPADRVARAEDYEVLADFITTHSAGRPVIVGGDFNLHTDRTPDGPVFEKFLHEAGLTDVCDVVDCGGQADRIDKFVFRSGGGVILEPLDHTFESEKFVRPTDGAPLSDHTPLHVPFRWSLDAAATGSIRGTVVDDTGAPLAGVPAWAYRPTDGWIGIGGAETGPDGTYAIEGLAPGAYQIYFPVSPDTGLRPEWYTDQFWRSGATLVEVTAGGVTPGIDVAFEAGAEVTGTVTDGSGQPVAGAVIWAYAPDDTWVGSALTTTGADGTYELRGLEPGTYRIRFTAPETGLRAQWYDHAITRAAATPVTVAVAGPPVVADAVMTP